MTKLGLSVDIAQDGREAVELCSSRHHDLIFMDCNMPVMNGFDAAALIRSQSKNQPRVPIIALTANSLDMLDPERCRNVGLDGYLSKPFDRNQLIDILEKWLDASDTNIEITDPSAFPRFNQTLSTSAGAPAVDGHHLCCLREEMGEDFSDLFEAFNESADTIFNLLSKAISDHQREEIERQAHNLKSAAANVGAGRLSTLARELEQLARQENLSPTNNLHTTMLQEYKRVRQALTAFVQTGRAHPL